MSDLFTPLLRKPDENTETFYPKGGFKLSSPTTKTSFLNMPKGFSALYFTQLFSTISFAVLYATLVLYMQEKVGLTTDEANTLTGVYFAYNFGLHLLSGFLGGRFFSYRGLVSVGLVFQLFGALILSIGSVAALYWGLAFMLVGTGTMVTCLNMLLSQLFHSNEVQRRETAFLWNYSGMNIGFILGFTLTGYYQLSLNYTTLFIITAANNVVALGILISQWKKMRDRNTVMSFITMRKKRIGRYMIGLLIVCLLVPTLHWLLNHAEVSDVLILTAGVLIGITLIIIALQHKGPERKRFFAFFFLLLGAQVFWIVYQLAPMSLTNFAKNNVDRHVFGFLIAPAWIQDINSLSICIGAPLLALFFGWLRKKHFSVSLPIQYSTGLVLSAVGLLILPIGIASGHLGLMLFWWLFATYVLQAFAELLISPVGYSMIGQLIPARWQSLCMGTVLLNAGVAAVLASFFSNYAAGTSGSTSPLITNISYSTAFSQMGWGTLAVAIALLIATPFINRLIKS